ncbi:transcriptional regulator TACO1-like protein [Mycena polygramma]|nr:transcriptional regulator TACO1-like protein [Mycena polygramma]
MFRPNLHLPVTRRVVCRSFCSTPLTLSGHNKWSKIKEKKGLNDAKKSAAYQKASREIMNAVRVGGGSADPETNSALAAVLRRLKDVPKENIRSAIEKAIKKRDQRGDDVVYEALAYNRVGLIIECTTDNPTRTFANIRQILTEHNSRLANVKFMFDRMGSVKVIASKEDELALIELIDIAMDNEAENAEESSSTDKEVELEFSCRPESLGRLTAALGALADPDPARLPNLISSEVIFAPVTADEEDPDMAAKISELVREIEDNEDTKRVWTSCGP